MNKTKFKIKPEFSITQHLRIQINNSDKLVRLAATNRITDYCQNNAYYFRRNTQHSVSNDQNIEYLRFRANAMMPESKQL